jgi:putative flippase GtrA
VAPTADPTATPATGVRALVSRLRDRFGHLVHELGAFGVVGGCAFVVDLVIFNVLRANSTEPIAAKAISTVIATTVAFVGNRFWTWRHRARSGYGREYVLYFFFNAVGLAIALGCLWLSHYGLGGAWPTFRSQLADNVAGLFVGTALGTLFRFWAYRRFVFIATAPVLSSHAAPPLAPETR